MMRISALVIGAALLLAGCFQSKTSLYAGAKPLQPFHPGAVTSVDDKGKPIHLALSAEKDGTYRLMVTDRGNDHGNTTLVRFFSITGLPAGLSLAEVRACGSHGAQCGPDNNYSYVLVRENAQRVEWSNPDCSGTLSKLSGIAVSVDNDGCDFSDRASFEKALRVAAAAPWKTGGYYDIH